MTRMHTGVIRRPSDAYPDLAGRYALRRMLSPRSVAVVGVGRRRGGAGNETLRALRDFGFRGSLYAVNRSGRPVHGVPASRTVAGLPEPVDLLVIAVPDDQVAGVLAGAGPRDTGGAVLLGTGLRRGDPAGDRHRGDVLRVAREHGIRLLGPACLGVLNTAPEVRLNASLAPASPPGGGLALAVRSGAMGVALLADAVREHCGISSLVSLGDEIDVTGADLLTHWAADPATQVVALSAEPFDEPGRFVRAVRAVSRRKPVLAIAGAPPAAGEDLLTRAGAVRTASLGETLDTARMLAGQPLPAGNRLAIVGNAGGLTALAACTARAHGFHLVPLSAPTRAELPSLSCAGRRDNPVDLHVDALPARIADAVETVATSDEVDILLLVLVGIRANVLAANLAALVPVLDDHPRLTVAAVVTGATGELHRLGRRGAPVFREPELALRALAHARDYAAWRREPPDLRAPFGEISTGPARAPIRSTLAPVPPPRPDRPGRRATW
jgi:acyl-CoA synthetase (NDP forming)